MPDPRIRNPIEIATRRAAELSGNPGMTPRGIEAIGDDSGAEPAIVPPTSGSGQMARAFKLDSSPLDSDLYFLL